MTELVINRTTVNNMTYADDTVLLAENPENFNEINNKSQE